MMVDAVPTKEITGHSGTRMRAPKTVACPALESHRLNEVLWATVGTVCLLALTSRLSGAPYDVSPLLVTIGFLLAGVWLVRRGHERRAAALMLGSLTVCVSYALFQNQGIQGQGVVAFPAILVFASVFGTRRLFLATLALITAVLTAVAVANLQGWRVNVVQPVSPAMLINLLAILFMTAFFVWIVASDLKQALARLQTENELLRESRARIDYLAHHDALTGLPNRVLARDCLEHAVALAKRSGDAVALIFLDLDDFRTINGSVGHATGDLLLRDVAKRLVHALRAGDTVSRQGGDEFLIVMGGIVCKEAAATAAKRIIDVLHEPFPINGMEASIRCSLGIAMFPEDGGDFDALCKNADLAMYRAKDSGRNAFRFYDAEMNSSIADTLHLISGIRTALANGEFELHYQPQYALNSGHLIGAEALIRWRHPNLGLIPPAEFIPAAERSGLVNQIGAWVLNEACRQAKRWQEAGLSQLVVAVNLSPVQFHRDDIEHDVINALAAANLSPSSIELELTESLLIADSERLSALLGRMRAMGVRFSIDDFGTGYSNLGYLKRFQVERLKIDRSFVHRLIENQNDEGIVRAIIEMAHSLKLEVVAEGIEDLPTLTRLIQLGCDCGQGFHWTPALPPEEFFDFISRNQVV